MTDKASLKWYQSPRLILGVIAILVTVGIAGWFSANEQEDPQFPYRNGFITLNASNMTISQLKDTAVIPLERAISEIDEVSNYQSRIKNGSATIDIELHEHIYETDTVWERIKDTVNNQKQTIPNVAIQLVDRAQDTQGIVIAITNPNDLLRQRAIALDLRTELEQLSAIRSVTLVGDPQEQIVIDYSQQAMTEFGISPMQIAQRFNNTAGTGISFENQGLATNSNAVGRVQSLEDIANSQITLDDASPIKMSTMADIYYRTNPIAPERFMVNGKTAVGLAVTLPANTVRVTAVGEQIKQVVERFNNQFTAPPAEIVLFQPKWTQKRKTDLLSSLATGCLAVAVVLVLLMSVRTAVIVVISIPTITLIAVGLFTAAQGVIHQMTIAGLVISLGLMVDNSIVMAEKIVQLIDQGLNRLEASKQAVKALYKPLATATVTTIAAFLPMLLAKGSVADFIATIPVLVILCISISYIIALAFIPILANFTLKNNTKNTFKNDQLQSMGSKIAKFSLNKKKTTLAGVTFVLSLIFLLPAVNGEFFPKTNRNQAYVDIQLPYGSSITKTTQVANEVSDSIQTLGFVTQTLTFSGSSGPRFYYNLVQQPGESHIARVVFEVEENINLKEIVERLNTFLPQNFPEALIIARELGQGPPIESPIEIRLISNNTTANLRAAEDIFMLVNKDKATQHVRRAYSYGVANVNLKIDQQSLSLSSLTEAELASYFAWQGTGLQLADLRYKTEPVSLILQDTSSSQSAERLMSLQVINNDQFLPISTFVSTQITGAAAVETRRNGRTELRVLADVKAGFDEESVLEQLQPELKTIANKYSVKMEFGGELEESEEANSALLMALPAGLILLFVALMIQFNSYKLTALVMISIPMGAIGAPIMLSLVNIPFGFMSLLGILALMGIVVNTAILLIDSTIEEMKKGKSKIEAIELAISSRLRAIILTTITTIIGMLPLTFGQSPLWPPLAWAVIGGLISSTLIMLFVMPICMHWLIDPKRHLKRINIQQ
ncbi:efflux RND transporter permease subunit [Pseudoalteromonas luteoviolacea]|uniref:efflux RND transporter permease subunit n=1 Tax=Pseudoalteromonas luteoviolacea TaxID=43657 RepID=UPI001EECFC70|nr:efflux RND transporter permease subunit [Pseudoalteromonas luteoviolacea]MCF6442833.1 efflux RND transporter permease subunit [Pseudoalteromonas luteoviolacea]